MKEKPLVVYVGGKLRDEIVQCSKSLFLHFLKRKFDLKP